MSSLNNCIISGSNDYKNLSQRYKELVFIQNEMLEEYNQLRFIAEKHGWRMLWGGFAILTLQWAYIGIGTYNFFSWDIMEPHAYVINSGNAMLLYSAYALRKQDLSREGFFQTIVYKKISKLSKQRNFDLKRFENISKEIEEIRYKL